MSNFAKWNTYGIKKTVGDPGTDRKLVSEQGIRKSLNATKADVVDDTAYGASWDEVDTIAPSKNTLYDTLQPDKTKLAAIEEGADVTPGLPSDEYLVGYWSLDEGSGTVAHDSSGKGNDGTLVNMEEADWVSGVVGTGLEFDGANEYVSKASNADLEPIENISVSAWVKFAGTATINTIIANTQTGSNGYLLFWKNNKLRFTVDAYASNFAFFAFPALPLNTDWHHIVGTYSKTDGKVKIYVDGIEGTEASYSSDIFYGSNLFTIGRMGSYGNEYYFEGLIDEVRIYNTALTANEVKALYLYPAGNKQSVAIGVINQGSLATQDESDITSLSALATLSHKLALANNLTLGSGDAGTSATRTLTLEVGTVPSSSPADAVQLYSEGSDAELKVRDELGNITVLSPHDFELFEPDKDIEFPWSYHSENPFIGKKINVDMAGVVKAVEELTGLKFIHTTGIKKKDWDLEQEKIKKIVEKKRGDLIFVKKPMIEVTEEEATEETTEEEAMEEAAAGRIIKTGFYFDSEKKVYYRFLTREEISPPAYVKKVMPFWLASRIDKDYSELTPQLINVNEQYSELAEDFYFESEVLKKEGLTWQVTIPKGFVLDWEVMPVLKGTSTVAGLIFSYLCRVDSTPIVTKKVAVRTYLEFIKYKDSTWKKYMRQWALKLKIGYFHKKGINYTGMEK